MIRTVLDTNIVVSAALRSGGNEAKLLQNVLSGRLAVAVSAAILAEYEDVLTRPKLNLDLGATRRLLQTMRAVAIVVEPAFALRVSTDDADNRFLECAEAAGANFLVTGNRRHFPRRWKTTFVVSSRELLAVLDRAATP